MRKNKKNIPLDKKEIEKMLPDFIFNKLNEDESNLFITSLHFYPDLESELLELQKTFSLINKNEIEEVFTQKTKNLSVKINERISNKQNNIIYSSFYKKYIPVVSSLIVIILITTFFLFKSDESKVIINNEDYKILNTQLNIDEINSIIDFAKNEDYIFENMNQLNEAIIPEDKSIETNIEEEYNQLITENIISYINNEKISTNNNFQYEIGIINSIEELNNEEFEIFEKELKNVKI